MPEKRLLRRAKGALLAMTEFSVKSKHGQRPLSMFEYK
jgi:hypothetical protein